ncbi:2-hydroxyacid dehydrogenase [Microbacterium sp. T2.11-28]|uniref:2-hydroxyacid dehydrogenase n=1 Tax=Microbacterium sp. T2.11-28 TaxID=3041169 RepID=UPI002477814D|nr:2-hydroxyacid dehydrogenase [Microbacterium sp. T2.11-28]CAI9389755.1 Glyoxylate/hydroxypyruvate reductase A [Microbacterium sp. T2.11-28]
MTFAVTVPTAELAADLASVPDDVEVIVWDLQSPAPRERLDIVVPPYMTQQGLLARLGEAEIGLVQGQAIGYEGVEDVLPPGIPFANASTVHETSTAELAVALTLAVQRHVHRFAIDGQTGTWAPVFADSLADRRVLLLGYGGVGTAIGARLAPFEVELVPVASRAREEDGVHVHGIDELAELLPTVDIVVASLPGGEATRHLIGDAELAALPDGALVVNVGRGPLIDTDALVRHVADGRIRAALDVTDPEPLPQDHPLWTLPGVLIAPHVGGASSAMRPRLAALLRRQIAHLRAGEEYENVVLPA